MLALEGVKVLDMATLFPAPLVGAMLGDFGADVVKVEDTAGDPQRVTGVMRGDRSVVWVLTGRNKRSIVLDLSTVSGLERLRALTAAADVVVSNQPRRVLQRWGCTYEEIAQRNPSAVMVSVSAFGTEGPNAELPGNGTLAEAYGGVTHMTGDPSGPPMLPSVPLGDCLGAMSGFMGAVIALYWRDARGGTGQYVDASMFEPVVALMGPAMAGWSPDAPPPMRTGSRVPGGVPRNLYRSADGRWLALSGTTDAQSARVREVIGRTGPADAARWGRSAERLRHGDELDGLVAAWIAGRPADDVLRAFREARVPIVFVNDLRALLADPHVEARGSVVVVDDPEAGPVHVPAPYPRLSATPGSFRRPAPALGADAPGILADWLGD
jgi:formyl-CoA transferase